MFDEVATQPQETNVLEVATSQPDVITDQQTAAQDEQVAKGEGPIGS